MSDHAIIAVQSGIIIVLAGARIVDVWIRYRREGAELDGGDAYGNAERPRRSP